MLTSKLVCLLGILLALGLCSAVLADQPPQFQPSLEGKKLIEYGWDCPNTAYVRQNAAIMERRPFDGVVIHVSTNPLPHLGGTADVLGWKVFGKYRFQPADYQQAIVDLQQTKWQEFTDNFIQIISMPGIDWFDPEWDAVAHNAKIMAKIAKQGRCVGLMFDPEQYGPQKMWTYSMLSPERRQELTKDQYIDQARECGRKFIRAVNSEFPDVKILCLFGPSLTAQQAQYDLLAPFYDGMSQAALPDTRIIDGYEQSYYFNTEQQFQQARQLMHEQARAIFQDQPAFDRTMRVGFGLWLDAESDPARRNGWFPYQPEKNYRTPELWHQVLTYALCHSDEYVWVYSERLDWWTPTPGINYHNAQQSVKP